MPTDPTQSKTLRERYARKLRGRYAAINTELRAGVRDRDAFGLSSDGEALARDIDRIPSYRFETDDRKHAEFMAWLRQQLDNGVLQTIGQGENEYVRTAYEKSIRHADAALDEQGLDVPEGGLQAAFNAPIHEDALALLYQRNYEGLKGINEEVAKQISRTLAEGFSQGYSPRKMAAELTDRIDSIGKTRATTLARTEVINAHAEGTLNRYEQAGVEQVTADVEFLTAQDRRVCAVCASLGGSRYTIGEARGVIPVHPRCRCAWLPVTPDN
ncbi:phage head morphogenesis protein [Halomarina oriensis]|uniref:Phage head morphogenesis protein n=1 Tax=Halomarina oriensis TaxID=671145 RepID=A0A6B0GJQ1_9EURY|nr:minor capsid protein [Halomarina oriensis]MWG34830.1 phage head morphogenesis protein [Halomarina oriensis]